MNSTITRKSVALFWSIGCDASTAAFGAPTLTHIARQMRACAVQVRWSIPARVTNRQLLKARERAFKAGGYKTPDGASSDAVTVRDTKTGNTKTLPRERAAKYLADPRFEEARP